MKKGRTAKMSRQYKKETICIQSGWKPKNGEPRVLQM